MFGWLERTFEAEERERSYSVGIGFVKGRNMSHEFENMELSITVSNETACKYIRRLVMTLYKIKYEYKDVDQITAILTQWEIFKVTKKSMQSQITSEYNCDCVS